MIIYGWFRVYLRLVESLFRAGRWFAFKLNFFIEPKRLRSTLLDLCVLHNCSTATDMTEHLWIDTTARCVNSPHPLQHSS